MQSTLDRHLKNVGKIHSILRDREFEKSRQQLEAKARELRVKGYGKRKNASHALNEEDEESSGSQVSSVNILLKPWSM